VSARISRARVQSLCGTARGLAHEKSASENKTASVNRRPCRHSAVWACQGSGESPRRMGANSLAARKSRHP
jgi:hypothetical protein